MEGLDAHMRVRYPNLDYPQRVCYIGEIKPLTGAEIAQMPSNESLMAVHLERRSKVYINVNISENEVVVYQSADTLYTHPSVISLYQDLLTRLRGALGRQWITLNIKTINRMVIDPT